MGTFKNPDVWKQNLAYQIGDFVLYNGVVYMAIKPVPAGTAMSADYWYAFDKGGGSATQTLTVTKNNESDTVSVQTVSWADAIADNWDAAVEVLPDSTDGLVSVYSIPIGTMFHATISNDPVKVYFDAEMIATASVSIMPSIPLYAKKANK